MKYKRWGIAFIVIFFLLEVSFIIAVNADLKVIFGKTDRLPNVRNIDYEHRLNLVEKFIDYKFSTDKEYFIVVGDSQPYGFLLEEKESFPYIFNKKRNLDIINLSVIDGRAKDVYQILELIKNKGVKIKFILYNFNLAHYSALWEKDYGRLPGKYSSSILFALHTARLQKDFYSSKISEGYPEKFTLFKYDKDRYKITNINDENLIKLIHLMKELAPDHLVILAPQDKKSFQDNNYDVQKYYKDLNKYRVLIEEAGIKTIDLSFKLKHDDFFDIVHLSRKGHQTVADILEKYFNEMKN